MMFGVDKFDLVVGNPPYLSSAEHAKANKDERRKITEFYDLSSGTYDLYIPFIELGIKHLKTNGSISMIVKVLWYLMTMLIAQDNIYQA